MNMRQFGQNVSSFYKKYQNSVNVLLLVILLVLVFYNSLSGYFISGDDFSGYVHPQSTNIFHLLTSSIYGGNYRPMELLSHGFDSYLYGDKNTFGRRMMNFLKILL